MWYLKLELVHLYAINGNTGSWPCYQHKAFSFGQIFVKLADKISDKWKNWPDQIFNRNEPFGYWNYNYCLSVNFSKTIEGWWITIGTILLVTKNMKNESMSRTFVLRLDGFTFSNDITSWSTEPVSTRFHNYL